MGIHDDEAVPRSQSRAVHENEDTKELYRSLFETTGAGVILVDPDGKFLNANPAFCRLLGYRKEELVGRAVVDVTHPEDRAETRRVFGELREGRRQAVDIEKRYERKDGTAVWVRVGARWRFGTAATSQYGVGVVQDITERKSAELALRQSRDRLEAIVSSATDAIVTIDSRGVIDSFNPAAERMFGYAKEEVLGANVSLLMPSPYGEEHDGYLARYLETGERRMIGIGREVEGLRKDGSTFPIDLAVSEVGHMGLFTGIIRDITERKRSEGALEESAKRLRALSSSLLTAQEEERRILSRELHDDLAHKLALLAMEIDRLEPAESPAKVRIKELVEDVAGHIRSLSHRIHPSAVEHLGLVVALRRECESVARATNRLIEFHAGETVPRHPPLPTAICFYRVAQESLQNAVRHSGSDRIEVSLERIDDGLRLSIEDQGEGFEVHGDPSEWGLGLLSMQERARLVGGELEIESTRGRGTIVSCWASLETSEQVSTDGPSASKRRRPGRRSLDQAATNSLG